MNVIEQNLSHMNFINLSTAWHRLAKLWASSEERVRDQIRQSLIFRAMQDQARIAMRQLRGQAATSPAWAANADDSASEMRCVSIICWSFATLRLCDESLFEHAVKLPVSRWQELKPFELSNVLWALTKTGTPCKGMFKELAPQLLRRDLRDFSSQCISTICWAFGSATLNHPALFDLCGQEVLRSCSSLTPQGFSNILWAFARVQQQDAALFQQLGDICAEPARIWTFKPQELSNTAWAFATVRLAHPRLFGGIAEVVLYRSDRLAPQNVANVIWAFSKCESSHCISLFPQLLGLVVPQLNRYKPQEIAAILSGLSRAPATWGSCRSHLESIVRGISDRLDSFQPQALACTAEAAVLLGLSGHSLCWEVVRVSLQKLASFQPPSLCTLLRALADAAECEVNRASASHPHPQSLMQQQPQQLQQPQQSQRQTRFHPAMQEVCLHIRSRLSEFGPHNMLHLQQTLAKATSAAEIIPQSILKDSVAEMGMSPLYEFDASRLLFDLSETQEVTRDENAASFNQNNADVDKEGKLGKSRRQRKRNGKAIVSGGELAQDFGTPHGIEAPQVGAAAAHPLEGVANADLVLQELEQPSVIGNRSTSGNIVGLLEATVSAEPAAKSDAPTLVSPPTGACGLAALNGGALTIRGSFLTLLTPSSETGINRCRQVQSEPPTPRSLEESRPSEPEMEMHQLRSAAGTGLYVQAAWARLRAQVPTLPRSELLLMQVDSAHCTWEAAQKAGWLLHSSWVDPEVGTAIAVILNQLWRMHGRTLVQCRSCLRCLEHSRKAIRDPHPECEAKVIKGLCPACMG